MSADAPSTSAPVEPTRKPKVVYLDAAQDGYVPVLRLPETVAMRSGAVVLQPNCSVGVHSTGEHEEAVIVLAGTGEMRLAGDTVLALHERAVAYCPPHTEHDVLNTGAAPLRYVYVVTKV